MSHYIQTENAKNGRIRAIVYRTGTDDILHICEADEKWQALDNCEENGFPYVGYCDEAANSLEQKL